MPLPKGGRIHVDKLTNCWCWTERETTVTVKPVEDDWWSPTDPREQAIREAAPIEPTAGLGTPADVRELRIRDACDKLAETLVSKQRAYGPSAITEAPGGPLNGLAVRIFDKHARLQNLVANPQAGAGVQDEALADTALDLAGYGIITGLVLSGQW